MSQRARHFSVAACVVVAVTAVSAAHLPLHEGFKQSFGWNGAHRLYHPSPAHSGAHSLKRFRREDSSVGGASFLGGFKDVATGFSDEVFLGKGFQEGGFQDGFQVKEFQEGGFQDGKKTVVGFFGGKIRGGGIPGGFPKGGSESHDGGHDSHGSE